MSQDQDQQQHQFYPGSQSLLAAPAATAPVNHTTATEDQQESSSTSGIPSFSSFDAHTSVSAPTTTEDEQQQQQQSQSSQQMLMTQGFDSGVQQTQQQQQSGSLLPLPQEGNNNSGTTNVVNTNETNDDDNNSSANILLQSFDAAPADQQQQQQEEVMPTEFTSVTSPESVKLIRNCTLLAQEAVVFSARPSFRKVVTSYGGFLVRVALGAAEHPAGGTNNNNREMMYRVGRITDVHEVHEPYKARGLLTDVELVLDVMPSARIRLTSISNSPITPKEFEEYIFATSDSAADGTTGFQLNPLAHAENLVKLGLTLQFAWRHDLVDKILEDHEQKIVIERNEKLNRARRNLASEVNAYAGKIELMLQQAQQQQMILQQQQRQQNMMNDHNNDGEEQNNNDENNNNNNNMMMMGGGAGNSSSQMQQSSQSFDADDSVLPSLDNLSPELVEELMSANSRFSSYIKNSTSSIPQLVALTERNRRKNELIGLRGERLRTLRDQRLIEQGLAEEPSDNIWTLNAGERDALAQNFNNDIRRDKTHDVKLIIEDASKDKLSKPERIRLQAIREASQLFSSKKSSNSSDDKNSNSDNNNMMMLSNGNNNNGKRDVNSVLGKFSSQDLFARLLRDAKRQDDTGAASSPSNTMLSQQTSSSTDSGSSSSFATTALFSIPRRRTRTMTVGKDDEMMNRPTNSASNTNNNNQASSSSLMMVPQNSSSAM